MSDPFLTIQRQVQLLTDTLERLRKSDIGTVAGTYTPTYQGGTTAGVTTYTTQQGAWTRVGNTVIVTGTVVWATATGTGDAQIVLPFTAANVANQNFAISIRTTAVTFASGTPQGQIAANTNYFTMQSPLTNAASTAVAVEAAGNVIFTAIYFI